MAPQRDAAPVLEEATERATPLVRIPQQVGDLQAQVTDIEEQGPQSVLSFFTPKGLGAGLCYSNYTVEEEVQLLASIARDEDELTSVRMAAIDMIRRNAKEALLLSGQLHQATATQTAPTREGGHITAELKTVRLSGTANQTEQMLLEAAQTSQVLTMENNHGKKEKEDFEADPEEIIDSIHSDTESAATRSRDRNVDSPGSRGNNDSPGSTHRLPNEDPENAPADSQKSCGDSGFGRGGTRPEPNIGGSNSNSEAAGPSDENGSFFGACPDTEPGTEFRPGGIDTEQILRDCGPDRDLGGGGLCSSAREEAQTARRNAYANVPAESDSEDEDGV